MKRICLFAMALLLFLTSYSSLRAASSRHDTQAGSRTASVTFRLNVTGQDPSLTYWVAYGPLSDHFGLVRLHSMGSNRYGASDRLPTQGRTIFAYLAGHGVMHTRFGPAPGNPVVTIKRIGPLGMSHIRLALVQWRVQRPAG
jgi:hypothetical protein